MLVVTLWLSGVVVDWMFISGGADVCACLFVDHCCVNVSIRVLNFAVGLNHDNSEVFPDLTVYVLLTSM